jgi:hypothetical protein
VLGGRVRLPLEEVVDGGEKRWEYIPVNKLRLPDTWIRNNRAI